MKDFPRRGEVWLVNWNPARGSEQAGKRPALVIQNDIGNEKSTDYDSSCYFKLGEDLSYER